MLNHRLIWLSMDGTKETSRRYHGIYDDDQNDTKRCGVLYSSFSIYLRNVPLNDIASNMKQTSKKPIRNL